MEFKTFTTQEIEAQGGTLKTSSLIYKGHHFERGPKCRKDLQQSIQGYCKILMKSGQGIALIEDELYITIWKQSQGFSPSQIDEHTPAIEKQTSSISTKADLDLQKTHSEPESLAALSTEFVDNCRKAMLVTIGPIANIILEETLSNAAGMGPQEFIAALCDHLGTSKQVEVFQKQVTLQTET